VSCAIPLETAKNRSALAALAQNWARILLRRPDERT